MRDRAHRLFEVRTSTGRAVPPSELEGWLTETFGSVAAVTDQPLVRVTNRVTLDATLFAPLRGRRPIDGAGVTADLRAEIDASRGDPFCHPESGTPEEPTGRVRGRRMITGSNAAMADGHHAILVFDEHDPLAFDVDLVVDLLETGRTWADRAHAADPQASNYLLIWNCLWRAGGSIVHGHAQALIGAGRPYARLERFRRDEAAYAAAFPDGDLVEELVAVHRSLGLAIDLVDGVTVIGHLTPMKDRELLVIGRAGMEETDPDFAGAVGRTLVAYRDRAGVRSFNLALWRRPLGGAPGWDRMPPIVRLVDRGDPSVRPSDIGAMELYATPVVGTDPYEVVAALR